MMCNSPHNTITLPARLRSKLAPLAKEKGMTVEAYAVYLLDKKLNQKKNPKE